jgi:hypothetical protein
MSLVRADGFRTIERRLLVSLGVAQTTVSAGSQLGSTAKKLTGVLHEAAFLRAFVAWERFLESSFLSYLMGQQPLRGRPPHRYYQPPNVASALNFLKGRRPYLDWTEAVHVAERAKAVFRNGGCFLRLQAQNLVLQDMKKVRNAISHDSDDARAKFEELVRRELTTLPPRCTPGGFLGTRNPTASTHGNFLDTYLGVISGLANDILRP